MRIGRRALLASGVGFCAVAVWADAPNAGLMWNETGLPLVFPLHVRTDLGKPLHVRLSDITSGSPVFAAFHDGGSGLFRVLCPPGGWRLTIATGRVWENEETLFGAGTEVLYDSAVSFGVTGLRTRQGVIVDLRRGAEV